MKKTIFLIAVAALLLSCQKNELNDGTIGTDVFNATLDNGFQTKTALQSDYKVWWKDSDKVNINGAEYTAKASEGDSTRAVLTATGSEAPKISATYHAFYPAGIASGKGATGTLPASITYDEGTSYLPMYAAGKDKNLVFKNICAAIRVNVSSSVTVKSISVTADKALNGAFTIVDNVAVMDKTSGMTDAEKTLTLDCGTTGVAGTSFYISVPAATYGSLTVTLTKGDGTKETMSSVVSSIQMDVNMIYRVNFRRDGSLKLSDATITELL